MSWRASLVGFIGSSAAAMTVIVVPIAVIAAGGGLDAAVFML